MVSRICGGHCPIPHLFGDISLPFLLTFTFGVSIPDVTKGEDGVDKEREEEVSGVTTITFAYHPDSDKEYAPTEIDE